jgi:dethiobiotin synthetase
MTQPFFITATGTDIGKTFVTCELIKQLKQRKYAVEALKPIISGWDEQDTSCDTHQILSALNAPLNTDSFDKISPWRFKAPLSPHMAAKLENQPIDYDATLSYCQHSITSSTSDYFFIEGVGGILVPITDKHTILDLIEALAIPTLLITGSYLGSISHTLSAFECLHNKNIAVHSIIISETKDSDVDLYETAETIESFTKQNTIVLPYNEPKDLLTNLFS